VSSFSLRPGRRDDAGALADFGARAFRDTFAAHNRPEDMDAYVSLAYGVPQQTDELTDPRVSVIVAESTDATLIGYAIVRQVPEETPPCVTGERPVELTRIYVDHGWHGRGVGEALMRSVMDRAHERGAGTLWLGVWEHNPRARAFYARWGFREVGEHSFPLGEDIQRDLLLARSIRLDEEEADGDGRTG
jgi:ribosomal protein S18 acetylase RimI-like enzyme